MDTNKQDQKYQVWTVVFLVDADPPQRIVLLKRALWKNFAPGMYTGIGGKEENGEGPLRCAAREMEEETGLNKIHLTEFARCILNSDQYIHYFWGHFPCADLPECNEGQLVWVDHGDMLGKPIIPTTFEIVREWHRRGFRLDQKFTIFEKIAAKKDTYALVSVEQILDGLFDGL